MKYASRAVLWGVATLSLSATCWAEPLKPGLWEMKQQMHSASGQLENSMAQAQQQMANLPPDQRRMVEQMMTSRGLMIGPAGAGAPGGMSMQVCLTPEMVQRDELPAPQQGECTTTRQPRSGSTLKFSFSCKRPPSSGEGEVSFSSPVAYTSKTVVRTQVQGREETISMNTSGKWLKADCGDVKPLRAPVPTAPAK